jgi:hypothetical protein
MVQYIGVIGAYLNGACAFPSRPRPTRKSLDLKDEYHGGPTIGSYRLGERVGGVAIDLAHAVSACRGASLDPIP